MSNILSDKSGCGHTFYLNGAKPGQRFLEPCFFKFTFFPPYNIGPTKK